MAQFGSIITNIGLAKIANAQITHDTVNIESMVLGDGNGAYYTISQNQTALRNEVWRGLLSDQRIDPSNPNRIEFSAFIPSSVGGFTIREVGLLDTEGNLIALSLYPEQYKPTLGEGISDDILIHFVIETSNASVITLAVDVTNVIATRQYVDKKTAEVNDALTTHLDENKQMVVLSRNAALSILNEENRPIPYTNIEKTNNADFCDIDPETNKIRFKKGIYFVTSVAIFAVNAVGMRNLEIEGFYSRGTAASATLPSVESLACLLVVDADNYLPHHIVIQTSGEPLNLNAITTTVYKLGDV